MNKQHQHSWLVCNQMNKPSLRVVLLYSTVQTIIYCFNFLIHISCRLALSENEIKQLQEQENNKTHEKNTNRAFPCAYCRTLLTSSTWITSENKNEKALFNHFLEKAIAVELEENEKKEREKEKEKEGKDKEPY